jgi:hypothetical protein
MAATIRVLGQTIQIEKAFVSGKDRIAVNGQVVFEGKIRPQTPQRFTVGSCDYTVESRTVGGIAKAIVIHLQICEKGKVVHSGVYDQRGNQVNAEAYVKKMRAIQACALVGGVLGFVTMMVLNAATGVVPGGAIGGALRGGGGAGLGYAVGSLIFGRTS